MSDTPRNDTTQPDHSKRDQSTAEDVLEAFNAEDIIDEPGVEDDDEPISPADDADAPPPG